MFIALSVLLAVACLVPAIAKLGAHPKMLASAGHFGIPWSRYRLIGVAELLAAAGVIAGLIWRSNRGRRSVRNVRAARRRADDPPAVRRSSPRSGARTGRARGQPRLPRRGPHPLTATNLEHDAGEWLHAREPFSNSRALPPVEVPCGSEFNSALATASPRVRWRHVLDDVVLWLHPESCGDAPVLDRLGERGMVALVLFGVRVGERADGVRERRRLAEVCRDRVAIA